MSIFILVENGKPQLKFFALVGVEPAVDFSFLFWERVVRLKITEVFLDEAQLDRWLTDTESVARHNNMDFAVSRAEERAAIIRYLKANSPQ